MSNNEDNIIICENCYEENEVTRKICKNCGTKLYRNGIDENAKKQIKNDDEYMNYKISNSYYTNENKIALAIKVIAIISAVLGILASLLLLTLDDNGIIVMIGIVATIISSVFIYALGEIIQKLENIDNNTRKNKR